MHGRLPPEQLRVDPPRLGRVDQVHPPGHRLLHGAAGLAEGDLVARGTFLGYESDIGCAHGVHLHFEVAIPDSLAHPIMEDGGYVIGRNLEPSVCGGGVTGSRFEAGQTYTATDCGVLVNPDLGTGPGDLVIE